MVLDLRLTKIDCRDDNQFFLYLYVWFDDALFYGIIYVLRRQIFLIGIFLQWFGKIWGCSALAKPLTEPIDDLFSELFWDAEIFRKSK